MTKNYLPVPVAVAKEIATRFKKAIVIINTWDTEHGLLHTTTYGESEKQKHQAAIGGDIAAKALGADMPRADFYEDFRKDDEDVLFFAFRYALGRRTGAVTLLVAQIKRHWKHLTPQTQKQIQDEINDFERMYGNLGGECDKEAWQEILDLEPTN